MSGSLEPPLQTLLARLRIAHHVPGRVRFKLAEGATGLAATLADAQVFVASLAAVAGVAAVNLNPLARSCTVEYDPARIPPGAWQDLLGGVPSAAAGGLAQVLAERWEVVRAR